MQIKKDYLIWDHSLIHFFVIKVFEVHLILFSNWVVTVIVRTCIWKHNSVDSG